MKRLALIALPLILASCATRPTQSGSVGKHFDRSAGEFGRPASGVTAAVLTRRQSNPSSWQYSIKTLDGPWTVLIQYGGYSGSDVFTATVTFPDKSTFVIPGKAVGFACYAISEEPELAAWATANGEHILSIGGTITATHSEGHFRFKGREFLGATVMEETLASGPFPGQRSVRSFRADGTQITP